MIATIASTTQPTRIASVGNEEAIYITVLTAGNLRLAQDPSILLANQGSPNVPQGGIPQAKTDGVRQYFGRGDWWAITDTAPMNIDFTIMNKTSSGAIQ